MTVLRAASCWHGLVSRQMSEIIAIACTALIGGFADCVTQRRTTEPEPVHAIRAEEPRGRAKRCVYCCRMFRRDNIRPLSEKEALLVPRMCPIHFNMHRPRKFFKEPQDPEQVCNFCTLFLRMFQHDCHFTSLRPLSHSIKMCTLSMEQSGRKCTFGPRAPGRPWEFYEEECESDIDSDACMNHKQTNY